MAAIEALRSAVDTLSRNPVLFLGGLVNALVLLPQNVSQFAGVPALPLLLQILTFFVTPFVVAGVVGMADEGLDGPTSFGTFLSVGRSRYLSLLVGKVIEFGITVLFGVLLVVAAVVVALALGLGMGAGGVASNPAAVGAGALVALAVVALVVLAFVVVMFLVQFFPVAIVVDEADAVEGFRRSVSVVRSNVVATLGYSVITLVVSLVASLPLIGFVVYRTVTADVQGGTAGGPLASGAGAVFSPLEVVALAAVSMVLTTVMTAFGRTYATAFYERHTGSIEDRVLADETGDFEF